MEINEIRNPLHLVCFHRNNNSCFENIANAILALTRFANWSCGSNMYPWLAIPNLMEASLELYRLNEASSFFCGKDFVRTSRWTFYNASTQKALILFSFYYVACQ